MHEPLYALQRDVDMLTAHLNEHCTSLTKLDWIAQKMKKLEEELTCQGEQMRRMEANMNVFTSNMALVMKHLKIPGI